MKFWTVDPITSLNFLSLHAFDDNGLVVPVKNVARFLMHDRYIGRNHAFLKYPALYYATILCTVV
jgi:hypothetical protein